MQTRRRRRKKKRKRSGDVKVILNFVVFDSRSQTVCAKVRRRRFDEHCSLNNLLSLLFEKKREI